MSGRRLISLIRIKYNVILFVNYDVFYSLDMQIKKFLFQKKKVICIKRELGHVSLHVSYIAYYPGSLIRS